MAEENTQVRTLPDFFHKFRYGGNYPSTSYAYIMRQMAKSYNDIPIDQFEKEQKDIRDRREARAAERIKALQNTVKKPAATNKKPEVPGNPMGKSSNKKKAVKKK